ncbi:hypothetical protein [Sorangium sp. So ce861]|uniref:hypothetical protein n=1 Tax=Sorangium sp. So ce861 TaxID=3133323 RepID=UPI003F621C72
MLEPGHDTGALSALAQQLLERLGVGRSAEWTAPPSELQADLAAMRWPCSSAVLQAEELSGGLCHTPGGYFGIHASLRYLRGELSWDRDDLQKYGTRADPKTAPILIKDDDFREIVERDLGELEAALTHGMHKSTALLAGSIAEAILIDLCDRNRTMASSYMKQREPFPEKASLDKLIEIDRGEGLIEPLTETMANAVREHRDLIHPDRERRSRPKVDAATVGALMSLLRLVAGEVEAAIVDKRVDQYEAK